MLQSLWKLCFCGCLATWSALWHAVFTRESQHNSENHDTIAKVGPFLIMCPWDMKPNHVECIVYVIPIWYDMMHACICNMVHCKEPTPPKRYEKNLHPTSKYFATSGYRPRKKTPAGLACQFRLMEKSGRMLGGFGWVWHIWSLPRCS